MNTDPAEIFLPRLTERRIVVCVGGGVAAYKTAELCRRLKSAGADVQVLMTPAAKEFVGSATFAALTGRRVGSDMFDPEDESTIGHIRVAEKAETWVVAPGTADLLAKMAHGLADSLVTTSYLAYRGPVLVAPAMNVHMWNHPATQANIATLRERGHAFVGPNAGEMACGHFGEGRMAEPMEIAQAVAKSLTPQTLHGLRVVITAGPTHEAIDAVRYLGNRSSGLMGYALAAEAAMRGADVVLISGPVALPDPWGVRVRAVTSARQMSAVVDAEAKSAQALIMTAAVADFAPRAATGKKLKKEAVGKTLSIDCERTRDILAEQGTKAAKQRGKSRTLIVGFAAEDSDDAGELAKLARRKLTEKQCAVVIANPISSPDAGFGSPTNRGVLVDDKGQTVQIATAPKRDVAQQIWQHLARRLGR